MPEHHRTATRLLAAAAVALTWIASPQPVAADDDAPLVFVPLVPCRVIDTRAPGAGGPLTPGAARLFMFRGPTRNFASDPNQGGSPTGCGVPNLASNGVVSESVAKAILVNIVAVAPEGPGHLTAWASDRAQPLASVINYTSGVTVANGVVLPLCDQVGASPCQSGELLVAAAVSRVHLVVDVMGYYHPAYARGSFSNVALGKDALGRDGTSSSSGFNTAVGMSAQRLNSIGYHNSAVGSNALEENASGTMNTAVGSTALQVAKASDNTAVGASALNSVTSGDSNTALGTYAGAALTTGSRNIAIGETAGIELVTGTDNIHIGHRGVDGDMFTTRIGTYNAAARTFITGIRGETTGNNNAIPVLIDSAGQLGTASSSLATKQDVAPLADEPERLQRLRPVSFRYREHAAAGDEAPQYGLIAEEVAATFPELVVFDAEGRPETVKYHLLVPLLLGEVQRLEGRLAAVPLLLDEVRRLEARLAALEARQASP